LEAAMKKSTLISIVEDDQPFRESMRKLVTVLGYTVESFPSAAHFLASPLLAETACLVADVHMPGMTGVELHRQLVDAGYAIPTILVTAYPDEVVRNRALKDGVVCYLSKPVDDDHLDRCLRSALKSGNRPEEIHEPSGPQPALMGVDDGSADRQSHSDSTGLCGVEGFENPLEMCRINSRS
jgi:FixJ family two-component response regulator